MLEFALERELELVPVISAWAGSRSMQAQELFFAGLEALQFLTPVLLDQQHPQASLSCSSLAPLMTKLWLAAEPTFVEWHLTYQW